MFLGEFLKEEKNNFDYRKINCMYIVIVFVVEKALFCNLSLIFCMFIMEIFKNYLE